MTEIKQHIVEVEVDVHHETLKAILVSTDGVRKNAVWIPKSVVEIRQEGFSILLDMPEQYAIDKGLV